jgi:CarD family transcriptional regulator
VSALLRPALRESKEDDERMSQKQKLEFTAGDLVVYPAHGVGRVDGVETLQVGGQSVSLYAITFEKERMKLKIPVSKAMTSGLRRLSTKDRLKTALDTLQGKSRVKRTMWSRRAQEYEAKINSGDPVSIAEVLRDLRRNTDSSEQSYSERQIYQAALERLAREVAAVEKIDEPKAAQKLEQILLKAA